MGLIFKNHLSLSMSVSSEFSDVKRDARKWVISVLFLLLVSANIDRFQLIGQTKLFQSNGGLDAVWGGPGVQGDVRRHGRVRGARIDD